MGSLHTLGEAMVTFEADRIGPLAYAHCATVSMAGSEATVAIGAARLGHRASWTSRLGDDESGRLIQARLRGEGVDVYAELDAAPTGAMIKTRPAAGQRRVEYHRAGSAASRMTPADLRLSHLAPSDVFHTSGITAAISDSARETAHEALRQARILGAVTSLDVNYRANLWSPNTARTCLLRLLPDVQVLFASLDEARLLLSDHDLPPGDAVVALRREGPVAVIVTDGVRGAWWADDTTSGHAEAREVVEVDPFGAGDAFVAGYLAAVLDGLPAAECVDRATDVAALAVSTAGDWEGLPRTVDLDRYWSSTDGISR